MIQRLSRRDKIALGLAVLFGIVNGLIFGSLIYLLIFVWIIGVVVWPLLCSIVAVIPCVVAERQSLLTSAVFATVMTLTVCLKLNFEWVLAGVAALFTFPPVLLVGWVFGKPRNWWTEA